MPAEIIERKDATDSIEAPTTARTTPQDDGKAIIFHMRDGTVWRNDLQGACPDLRFDGFVWTVRGTEEPSGGGKVHELGRCAIAMIWCLTRSDGSLMRGFCLR